MIIYGYIGIYGMNRLAIDILNNVAQECDERMKNSQLSDEKKRILAEASMKITEFIEEVVEAGEI
jgi:hypothetical protein